MESDRKCQATRPTRPGSIPDRTLDEIGKVMGVTRERIRQLEQQALVRLRASHLTPGREAMADPAERHIGDAA